MFDIFMQKILDMAGNLTTCQTQSQTIPDAGPSGRY